MDVKAHPDLPGIPAKLAAPARRALLASGLTSLAKLSKKTEAEVLELHGMGANAMKSLKAAMIEAGVHFRKQ